MQKLDGAERVSTGPLQIGDDWPGYFIRGDEAMGMASDLRRLAYWLHEAERVGGEVRSVVGVTCANHLNRLADEFLSCRVP